MRAGWWKYSPNTSCFFVRWIYYRTVCGNQLHARIGTLNYSIFRNPFMLLSFTDFCPLLALKMDSLTLFSPGAFSSISESDPLLSPHNLWTLLCFALFGVHPLFARSFWLWFFSIWTIRAYTIPPSVSLSFWPDFTLVSGTSFLFSHHASTNARAFGIRYTLLRSLSIYLSQLITKMLFFPLASQHAVRFQRFRNIWIARMHAIFNHSSNANLWW